MEVGPPRGMVRIKGGHPFQMRGKRSRGHSMFLGGSDESIETIT